MRRRVDQRMGEARVAYDREGFPVKEEKVEPASTMTTALGLVVDGDRGVVAANVAKVKRLVGATRAVLRRGRASGRMLQQLLGHWTWFMMARRSALAIFARCHEFCRKLDRKWSYLWPRVRGKLVTACRLAPLLQTNIRAPLAAMIMACDASESGFGVAYAVAPLPAVQAAVDKTLAAPSPSFIGPSGTSAVDHAPDEPRARRHDDEVPLGRPLWRTLRWKVAARGRRRYDDHITHLEVRAAAICTRWWARARSRFHHRVLIAIDNQAVERAVGKGRSSPPKMLLQMRRIGAVALATDTYWISTWVPSEDNPADGPSRMHSI